MSADGLTKKQIGQLKSKGVRHLEIKESMPLVPLVLLGAIASLFVGDMIWLVVQASLL